MRFLPLFVLSLFLLIPGCSLLGEKHQVKVSVEVVPSKVSINEGQEVEIKVRVLNIAKGSVTVNIDAANTEGLLIVRPDRTTFTLKPEESRILNFKARIKEDALPGDYIVDIVVKTDSRDEVVEKAKLKVIE